MPSGMDSAPPRIPSSSTASRPPTTAPPPTAPGSTRRGRSCCAGSASAGARACRRSGPGLRTYSRRECCGSSDSEYRTDANEHKSQRSTRQRRVIRAGRPAWWLHHPHDVHPAQPPKEEVMAKTMRTSTSHPTVLQRLGLGAATTTAIQLTTHDAAHAGLRAEPTMKGRELLRVIAMTRQAWRNAPDQLSNPGRFEAFERHVSSVLFET